MKVVDADLITDKQNTTSTIDKMRRYAQRRERVLLNTQEIIDDTFKNPDFKKIPKLANF